MASLIFKRFFEVRLLHEYYFMQSDGSSIFDIDTHEWDTILADKVINGQYDIRTDLSIIPTEACKKTLADFSLKFAVKPTGFIVGIGVEPDLVTPKVPFNTPVSLQFLVNVKNPVFRSFSSESSRPSSYYFSNRLLQLGRRRTPPVLSAAIAKFSTQKLYSMGELAMKANKLQLARKTTNSASAADWLPLSEQSSTYAYVNEQDSCLFSSKVVRYQGIEPILTVKADLSDGITGSPLKIISMAFKSALQTVGLDFSTDNSGRKIPDGLYKLTTSYNDKASVSEMIYFNDSLANSRPYALIDITTDGQGGFALLNEGKRVSGPNAIQPVFDILMKSRATYWRYRSANRKKLSKPDGYDFLQPKDDDLITVDPRLLSTSASSFKKVLDGVTTVVFMPAPDVTSIRQADDITYADVFVSKI